MIIFAFFLFVKFKLMMRITLFNVHADDVSLIFGHLSISADHSLGGGRRVEDDEIHIEET